MHYMRNNGRATPRVTEDERPADEVYNFFADFLDKHGVRGLKATRIREIIGGLKKLQGNEDAAQIYSLIINRVRAELFSREALAALPENFPASPKKNAPEKTKKDIFTGALGALRDYSKGIEGTLDIATLEGKVEEEIFEFAKRIHAVLSGTLDGPPPLPAEQLGILKGYYLEGQSVDTLVLTGSRNQKNAVLKQARAALKKALSEK